jgi:hypothetical protein
LKRHISNPAPATTSHKASAYFQKILSFGLFCFAYYLFQDLLPYFND